MPGKYTTAWISVLLALHLHTPVGAQSVKEPANPPATWSAPYEPFRIAGNLYYVGTNDLAVYLITTAQGHILINTGLAASAALIRKNIESLGFRMRDLKILLTSQAHYDHVGAMAEIQRLTGAKCMVSAGDAPVMRDGGSSDYAFGGGTATFEPVEVSKVLQDGEAITLGDMKITMLSHPGHTRGSASYTFTVKDNKRSYRILIANLPTIIISGKFKDVASYPDMVADYQKTFASLQKLDADLWLAAHASQFHLHQLRKPGDPYNPLAFSDKQAYKKAVADLKQGFEQKLSEE